MLIYSSVIEINQISVIFFCNNYNYRPGTICLGCLTREFDQIITDLL